MKKFFKAEHWWLILIFVISLGLRLYKLGQLPSILNRDEAALAYNAYLISEGGRDEWGRSWPVAFESFGDFKLPGYIYSVAILFKFLPLADWVVRLPAALAGSLLPLVGYYLARRLEFRRPWSMLFALILATSPVFLFFSRMAFEANLALSLFLLGLTLVLVTQKNNFFQIAGSILIGLSILTYNSPLILLPFVVLALIYWHKVNKSQNYKLSLVLLLIFGLLAGWQLFSLSSQKSDITLFQDESTWMKTVEYRQSFNQPFLQKTIGHKYVFFLGQILKNYFLTLSPQFLLKARGGHPWHSPATGGHFILITYIFFIVGLLSSLFKLILALKKKKWTLANHRRLMILFLTLTGFIPAVITVDAPHATRSLFGFVMLGFLALIGMKDSYHFFRDHSQIKKPAFLLGFVLATAIFFGQYLKIYFGDYPQHQQVLKPGLNQVLKELDKQYPSEKIAVLDGDGYDYVLFAWYEKLPVETFYQTVVRQQSDKIGFKYGQAVSRYHFIVNEIDRDSEEPVLLRWAGNSWLFNRY